MRNNSLNLEGKWVWQNDHESKDDYVQFWFYKDYLLYFSTATNAVLRKKYILEKDSIIFFELDGVTESYNPPRAEFIMTSNESFKLIVSDDDILRFIKIENFVDSISFFTVKPNDIRNKY